MNLTLTQTTSFYCTESFDEKIEFQNSIQVFTALKNP